MLNELVEICLMSDQTEYQHASQVPCACSTKKSISRSLITGNEQHLVDLHLIVSNNQMCREQFAESSLHASS